MACNYRTCYLVFGHQTVGCDVDSREPLRWLSLFYRLLLTSAALVPRYCWLSSLWITRRISVDTYSISMLWNRVYRINDIIVCILLLQIFVKLVEQSDNWSGVIRFGFTSHNPASLKGRLPKYACPGMWTCAFYFWPLIPPSYTAPLPPSYTAPRQFEPGGENLKKDSPSVHCYHT